MLCGGESYAVKCADKNCGGRSPLHSVPRIGQGRNQTNRALKFNQTDFLLPVKRNNHEGRGAEQPAVKFDINLVSWFPARAAAAVQWGGEG